MSLDDMSNGPEVRRCAQIKGPVREVTLECDLVTERLRVKATKLVHAPIQLDGAPCEEQVGVVMCKESHTDLFDGRVPTDGPQSRAHSVQL